MGKFGCESGGEVERCWPLRAVVHVYVLIIGDKINIGLKQFLYNFKGSPQASISINYCKRAAYYHLSTLLIFHSSTFLRLSSPWNSPIYLSMFLLAFATANVTLALSTSFLSFLSGFSDLAASKYDW